MYPAHPWASLTPQHKGNLAAGDRKQLSCCPLLFHESPPLVLQGRDVVFYTPSQALLLLSDLLTTPCRKTCSCSGVTWPPAPPKAKKTQRWRGWAVPGAQRSWQEKGISARGMVTMVGRAWRATQILQSWGTGDSCLWPARWREAAGQHQARAVPVKEHVPRGTNLVPTLSSSLSSAAGRGRKLGRKEVAMGKGTSFHIFSSKKDLGMEGSNHSLSYSQAPCA